MKHAIFTEGWQKIEIGLTHKTNLDSDLETAKKKMKNSLGKGQYSHVSILLCLVSGLCKLFLF